MTLRRFAAIAGTALAVLVINVAISFLYMVVYSYVLSPRPRHRILRGARPARGAVQQHRRGDALMYLAGRWIGGRWDRTVAVPSALGVWLAYAAIDLAVVIPAATARLIPLVVVSLATKLAAAYLGGRAAMLRAALAG